jgi:hypothetical protein
VNRRTKRDRWRKKREARTLRREAPRGVAVITVRPPGHGCERIGCARLATVRVRVAVRLGAVAFNDFYRACEEHAAEWVSHPDYLGIESLGGLN